MHCHHRYCFNQFRHIILMLYALGHVNPYFLTAKSGPINVPPNAVNDRENVHISSFLRSHHSFASSNSVNRPIGMS